MMSLESTTEQKMKDEGKKNGKRTHPTRATQTLSAPRVARGGKAPQVLNLFMALPNNPDYLLVMCEGGMLLWKPRTKNT